MTTIRMLVNPSHGHVTYEIEGSAEEMIRLDLGQIVKLNELADQIAGTLTSVKQKEKSNSESTNQSTEDGGKENGLTNVDRLLEINVPNELVEKITTLDERVRMPLLWYFSNRHSMTVKEFLMACAKKGFSLSASWLPSTGGNFKNRLVNEDKMFREANKIGREIVWDFTDVGKLKIMKEIEKLGYTS